MKKLFSKPFSAASLRVLSATLNRGFGTTWCPAKEPTSHLIMEIVVFFDKRTTPNESSDLLHLSFSGIHEKTIEETMK
jgi:hypothetical protein